MYKSGTIKAIVSGHSLKSEIFAFGWQMDGANIATQNDLEALATDIIGLMENTTTNAFLLNTMTTAEGIDALDLYQYTGGAKASSQAHAAFTGMAGKKTTVSFPLQVACCVTLLTGKPGRSRKGRLYLPGSGIGFNGGEFANADVDAIAAGFNQLFQDLLDRVPSAPVVVASATTGENTPVTQVRVDSKPDTQRRRSMKAAANYTKVSTGIG